VGSTFFFELPAAGEEAGTDAASETLQATG
jgi:hypothetical protein